MDRFDFVIYGICRRWILESGRCEHERTWLGKIIRGLGEPAEELKPLLVLVAGHALYADALNVRVSELHGGAGQ